MKEWYESKTMWVNIIGLLLTMLAFFLQHAEQLPYTPEQITYIIIFSKGIQEILNLILRKITRKGIM